MELHGERFGRYVIIRTSSNADVIARDFYESFNSFNTLLGIYFAYFSVAGIFYRDTSLNSIDDFLNEAET